MRCATGLTPTIASAAPGAGQPSVSSLLATFQCPDTDLSDVRETAGWKFAPTLNSWGKTAPGDEVGADGSEGATVDVDPAAQPLYRSIYGLGPSETLPNGVKF